MQTTQAQVSLLYPKINKKKKDVQRCPQEVIMEQKAVDIYVECGLIYINRIQERGI